MITITIKAVPKTLVDSNKGNDSNKDKSSNKDNDSKTVAKKSVKTGDNTNLSLWIALMLLGVVGMIGVTVYTRRKRTNG